MEKAVEGMTRRGGNKERMNSLEKRIEELEKKMADLDGSQGLPWEKRENIALEISVLSHEIVEIAGDCCCEMEKVDISALREDKKPPCQGYDREGLKKLREDILQDREKKGLSSDLNDVVKEAYLVCEEFGDIWRKFLLDPLPPE